VAAEPPASSHAIHVGGLHAGYGSTPALTDVNLDVAAGTSVAIVGPAGAGKSTLLRCLNRLHEETPGARVSGQVSLGGLDLYGPGIELASLRRSVPMVFSAPNLFPTRSVADNVAAGLRLAGVRRRDTVARVRDALVAVSLWDELEGRSEIPTPTLAAGQQQRLCLARTLVLDPEVILLDDPCATLDPAETAAFESVLITLRGRHTMVMATADAAQAGRVCGLSGFLHGGGLQMTDEGR
jgi:phosphate transport system ATP-binding protein